LVTTVYADDVSTRARFRHANSESFDVGTDWLQSGVARGLQEGAAALFLVADDPNLLAGEDKDKVTRASQAHLRARGPMLAEIFNLRTNWSLTTAATSAWARWLFPQIPSHDAVERLWRAIFQAARLDLSDPIAAWKTHTTKLNARVRAMNERNLSAIHFRGPDTDLRVGLSDRHTWISVSMTGANPNGVQCVFNIPSEEINTVPDRNRVEGYCRMTKPLFSAGLIVEDIVVRFEKGRVIEASARTGADGLRAILNTDDGACRLGEVALVPNSSPISRSETLYGNTLLDENAASHIAFGQAWSVGIDGGLAMSADELQRHGANQSLLHMDTMIGSAAMDVDGITAAGRTIPVMRSGEFVEELDGKA
jgi:aminopeptidase